MGSLQLNLIFLMQIKTNFHRMSMHIFSMIIFLSI